MTMAGPRNNPHPLCQRRQGSARATRAAGGNREQWDTQFALTHNTAPPPPPPPPALPVPAWEGRQGAEAADIVSTRAAAPPSPIETAIPHTKHTPGETCRATKTVRTLFPSHPQPTEWTKHPPFPKRRVPSSSNACVQTPGSTNCRTDSASMMWGALFWVVRFGKGGFRLTGRNKGTGARAVVPGLEAIRSGPLLLSA